MVEKKWQIRISYTENIPHLYRLCSAKTALFLVETLFLGNYEYERNEDVPRYV